jgi:hypothetical protein
MAWDWADLPPHGGGTSLAPVKRMRATHRKETAMFRATIASIAIAAFALIISRAAIADEVKCEGAIVQIDGDTVTVKDMSKEHRMKIEPATKITSAGKPVMVSDLKVGQKVKCVCDKKDGGMICTSMEIMRDTP